jgi:hypothetical protein
VGKTRETTTAPEGEEETMLEVVLSRRGRLWLRRHPRRRPRLTVIAQSSEFPDQTVELRLRVKVPRP